MKNMAQGKTEAESGLYQRQNRAIHQARRQLCLSIDDCRELAAEIGGKLSLSGLTADQRWELIDALIALGAKVKNPPVRVPHPQAKDFYGQRLAFWKKRFPRPRPGFASNKQLAWIESLWELDFQDDRFEKSGLRGFIRRQTMNLPHGPVSDLAFLREHHVDAVITPLKGRAVDNMNHKQGRRQEASG